MENKRGNIWGIILVIGGIFVLMLMGFLFALSFGIMNWIGDVAVPELQSLGMVGSANISEAVDYTIVPLNSILQQSKWVGGLFYMFGLLSIFMVAFVYRSYNVRFMIPLFFGLMVILFIASLFISNMYEGVYNDTTELGASLREQVLLSNLLLYSPAIISFVGFIAGAIMFSGAGVES